MSKSSNKLNTYTVWAKLNAVVTADIKASSLEDALAQAVELKEDNFVEFLGDYSDGSLTVVGVLLND